MALHLIISGLIKIFDPVFSSEFLDISVQLLNFAVLLSYPINFFIYCRMSRAFRDAFTQLLCPSMHRSRHERTPSTATHLIARTSKNNNNNHLELNNRNSAIKNTNIELLPASTVILNNTTAETSMSLTPSASPYHNNNDKKKRSILSFGKQRVLFRDDVNTSTNTKFTDL